MGKVSAKSRNLRHFGTVDGVLVKTWAHPGIGDLWPMPLIWLLYYGDVGIAPWEWLLGIIYLIVLYLYFGRVKRMNVKQRPEYRHFLWGLYAKVAGGAAFSLVYFYYYGGGDTIMYFYSAVSMGHLAQADPLAFLQVLFGPNDLAHLNLFSGMEHRPYGYMFYDAHSFMVIRMITPLVLLSMGSYVVTTLLLSSICYIGIWRCYRTFVGYFPSLTDQFAIAFLYMPSLIFWGSGIMKDTLTLSAACWWVHCFDHVIFKRRDRLYNSVGLAVAGAVLILLKPYIFMVLMPMTLLWALYFPVSGIRNRMLRTVILPLVLVVLGFSAYRILDLLGGSLGKFGLEEAMTTTVVLQEDMKRSEQYGTNYFDIGPMENSLKGMLVKFPVAANAALFRPYLWESGNVVMALSALENAWLMGLACLVAWRARGWFVLRCMTGNPLVMMCMLFALMFGYIIGLTTPNFGALVRFKIPLIPFLVSGLYIIGWLNRRRLEAVHHNRRFDMHAYRSGETLIAQGRQTSLKPYRATNAGQRADR